MARFIDSDLPPEDLHEFYNFRELILIDICKCLDIQCPVQWPRETSDAVCYHSMVTAMEEIRVFMKLETVADGQDFVSFSHLAEDAGVLSKLVGVHEDSS